ncbi:probable linoleate 9S-lipoxygenase 5 isoform X1 [Zingiber officinale]|uniref:probable linoleate 9S-lipoxygenase 5 isoform X1 n=1 Tax=Zingiber officinale TaxID=94328 RepID=UPI001C4CCB11|nr:probable linoleate 9S-lipoxygenase 5 isoform X1 [Zingiber officinale]
MHSVLEHAFKGDAVAVEATVVLMRKNVLDFNDFTATLIDNVQELLGQSISFQLVSATVGDPIENGNRGVVGEKAYLEYYVSKLPAIAAGESTFRVTFKWEGKQGIPGAVIVVNRHSTQFYLKSITLKEFPGERRIDFVCNSWVYPRDKYNYKRIFFANKTYFAAETPLPLKPYREDELKNLRGEDVTGQLQEWDRVYDYAYYNDLGDPDSNTSLARPVLGGSARYPYPRRGKTGRKPSKTDPETESRLPATMSLDIYVPRDERFGHLKMADFLTYAIKALGQAVLPVLKAICDETPNEFDSFEDVLKLYEGGLPVVNKTLIDELRERIPLEMIRELFRTEGNQRLLKLPLPQVIQEDKYAWRTDEEFTREMLAGVNPVSIRRLEEFPPVSKLDEREYGDHRSTITAAQIEHNLEGLTIEEALDRNRLFILDHHDSLMPYLNRINSTANKVYATRTLLFLRDDSTLKPLAIELSLPHPDGEQHGAVSKVYTPADSGVEASIWQLAKAYVTVDDSGVHQLISHWLNTHATMEPFVIATNRHLSVLHPINKLLAPHYRDTMNINAFARQILINAGGILELTVFPAKYAMEMSSVVYQSWNFVEQGLPADLIKRGIAVRDSNDEIELLIKDYPYAVDGLAIWSAIETWVRDYCAIYYPNDAAVRADAELQAWWKEVREEGHGDKKHEPWWPKMETVAELTETCTTIIWVASALHAAVNFGQYPYAGYLPNRPTISRRFMPERGTEEFAELERDPDKVFLKTITSQLQTILGVSLIEILSTHSADEVYLGQRDTAEWTADRTALDAFKRFGAALRGIEAEIVERNGEGRFKNRNGPVKVPYTLLYPTSGVGITGKGIPNSVSI